MNKLSDNLYTALAFETVDIGGTDCWGADDTLGWASLELADSFLVMVTVGTWNVADKLDTIKLQQATSSAGAGIKNITAKVMAAAQDGADGQTYILECRGEDLDVDNGFTHVRVIVGENDDTGPDFVTAHYVRGNVAYKKDDLNSATQSI